MYTFITFYLLRDLTGWFNYNDFRYTPTYNADDTSQLKSLNDKLLRVVFNCKC